ncbi:hypothetical protein [Gaoshiqia sp. Z1-71]|uniref:hypothetical protein n=1 Tax=Gaoshiqia hydrogeniformans TaxID=3290090 RepID=UPI003BF7F698
MKRDTGLIIREIRFNYAENSPELCGKLIGIMRKMRFDYPQNALVFSAKQNWIIRIFRRSGRWLGSSTGRHLLTGGSETAAPDSGMTPVYQLFLN